MKRDTRYKAFNNKWFIKNQQILLRLLNERYINVFFREIFGITSINKNIPVVSIMPNHFKAYIGNNEYFASFYHYDHFSNVVYTRMKYIWRAIHFWDIQIANRLFPSLNLGFDDLEESTFEMVTKGNCWVGSTQVSYNWGIRTWEDIRNGVGEGGSSAGVLLFAGIEAANYDRDNDKDYMVNFRSVISYNTSYLGTNIRVTNVVIRPYFAVQSPTPTPLSGSPYLALVAHNKVTSYVQQSNDVTSDDYIISMFSDTEFASLAWSTYMSWNNSTYYSFTLNQAGLNYVQSRRLSHCAFGFLLSCDLNDDEPETFVAGAKSVFKFDFDENSTLDITYNIQPQRIVMMQ